MTNSESQLAEQQLARAEQRNADLQAWIDSLGRTVTAIGAIAEVCAEQWRAFEASARKARQ